MLGDSGKSFVVGTGEKPPTRTQDRGAACPDPPAPCNIITSLLSSREDSHELTGALIQVRRRSINCCIMESVFLDLQSIQVHGIITDKAMI